MLFAIMCDMLPTSRMPVPRRRALLCRRGAYSASGLRVSSSRLQHVFNRVSGWQGQVPKISRCPCRDAGRGSCEEASGEGGGR